MPSNFGSIDELLQQAGTTQAGQPGNAPLPKPAATSTPKPSAPGRLPSREDVLSKKMREIGGKEQEMEAQRFAQQAGVPHIDLSQFPVSHEALRQIAKEDAERLGAVCFFASQDEFRIGALDPSVQEVKELVHAIEERTHAHGAVYLISKKSLERILKLYATLPNVAPITKDIEVHADDLARVQEGVKDFKTFQNVLKGASTTDLVTLVLGAGLKLDASDVHIEAEATGIVVRLRIDGILQDAAELPTELYKQLVSRIKLVSSLKINITDTPQDGRFTIKLPDGDVDVRVSTIPTVYGESIVMRLLRQNREGLTLEQLGFSEDALAILRQEIARPNGMIVTTGPTGSGKTTTLYAVMQLLNKPGVKILTLEDPVEYKMEGINQSQVDPSHGYTFAKGLRSLLRQDPDIVMVGEIRDLETADIAVQAALTGHLMLSTIHTNSAAGAIPRFLSMGVKPFLLEPALNAIMGQRLVRRLRDETKVPATLDSQTLERVQKILSEVPEDRRRGVDINNLQFSAGKEGDGELGYKGRIGIYEIFTIADNMKELIHSGNVSEYQMEELAKQNGMLTMVQDGLLKAAQGLTSVEEVFRVTE